MLDDLYMSREMDKISEPARTTVLNHMGAVPVRLGALAQDLGVQVTLSSLPTGISGMIRKSETGYEIKINRHESRERQRFTLAHEIAHFLLHRTLIDKSEDGIQDNVLYRSGEPQAIEFEANRLAADIIMPPAKIEAELARIDSDISELVIEDLARTFGVSKAAMEIRVSGR